MNHRSGETLVNVRSLTWIGALVFSSSTWLGIGLGFYLAADARRTWTAGAEAGLKAAQEAAALAYEHDLRAIDREWAMRDAENKAFLDVTPTPADPAAPAEIGPDVFPNDLPAVEMRRETWPVDRSPVPADAPEPPLDLNLKDH